MFQTFKGVCGMSKGEIKLHENKIQDLKHEKDKYEKELRDITSGYVYDSFALPKQAVVSYVIGETKIV